MYEVLYIPQFHRENVITPESPNKSRTSVYRGRSQSGTLCNVLDTPYLVRPVEDMLIKRTVMVSPINKRSKMPNIH